MSEQLERTVSSCHGGHDLCNAQPAFVTRNSLVRGVTTALETCCNTPDPPERHQLPTLTGPSKTAIAVDDPWPPATWRRDRINPITDRQDNPVAAAQRFRQAVLGRRCVQARSPAVTAKTGRRSPPGSSD